MVQVFDSKAKAGEAWPVLVDCASGRKTISYGELGDIIEVHVRPLRYVLAEIQTYCKNQKLAPLSLLVVNQSGQPGTGFIEWVTGSFEEDLNLVFDEDYSFDNPFLKQDAEKKRRNPNWSRDELILALDLYMDVDGQLLDDTDERVIALSKLLNGLYQRKTNENFRNSNGVSMKLGNFSRFDPKHIAAGRKGLSRGAKADEEVWNDFYPDRKRLKRVANAIKSSVSENNFEHINVDDADFETVVAREGKVLTRIHRSRERDRKLVNKKKRQVLQNKGGLACEVCGFDFKAVYGQHGEGYIECHHTVPLSEYIGEKETKLSDLALLCANCHRMVHSKKNWLSLEELKAIMFSAKA